METKSEEQIELEKALGAISTAMLAMYQAQSVLNLIGQNGAMDKAGFDSDVACAVGLIHCRIDSTLKELEAAGF